MLPWFLVSCKFGSFMKIGLAIAVFLTASLAFAQERPGDGSREVQVWTGGGHSVSGGTTDTSVWNLGVRYGWVITRPHGPGFLKGRFEYAEIGRASCRERV